MLKPLSNPTARVLQILEHLSLDPAETYGLSQLARSLGITKSTCLSIMNTLVEGGYVIQHPVRRHYSLGPAIIAIGQSALRRFPDVSALAPELDRLSAALAMPATVETVTGDQIVVIASAGAGDPMHGIGRAGVRLLFAPPYGAPLAAGLPEAQFNGYLARATPALTADERESLLAALSSGRERGYFVSLDLPVHHALHDQLMDAWQSRAPAERLDTVIAARRHGGYFLDGIDPAATYTVTTIAAAIPVPKGAAPCALALLPQGRTLSGTALVSAIEMLRTAAGRAAASMH